jgi:hypothetical protein
MAIVRENVDIGPHVVHNSELLEQGIYRLTGEMSEIIILSPVSRIQPCLNIRITSMSILQLQPNPLFEPDRIRIDTAHGTGSRLPYC